MCFRKVVLTIFAVVRVCWCQQQLCDCSKYDYIEYQCQNSVTLKTCNEAPNTPTIDETVLFLIGGEPADLADWPYLVSLQLKVVRKGEGCYSHFCAGSLISPNVVLTAAHCFQRILSGNKGIPNFDIYVAQAPPCRHLFNSVGQKGQRSKVELIEIYPDFLKNGSVAGDIAVVVLNTNLPGPYVQLQKQFSNTLSSIITIAGYGSVNPEEHQNKTLYNMRELQQGKLSYQLRQVCEFLLDEYDQRVKNPPGSSKSNFDEETMICGFNQELDSCKGDSGGPAVLKGVAPEQDVLVGVMSWGPIQQCISLEQGQAPAIFARISAFQEWIQRKTDEYAILQAGLAVDDSYIDVGDYYTYTSVLDPFAQTTDVVWTVQTP